AASDGYVVLGATNDAMFARLLRALDLGEALGRPQWQRNAARVADREVIEGLLGERVATLTIDEVLQRLRTHRVLVAPVTSPDVAARSAQSHALDLVIEEDGVVIARS